MINTRMTVRSVTTLVVGLFLVVGVLATAFTAQAETRAGPWVRK